MITEVLVLDRGDLVFLLFQRKPEAGAAHAGGPEWIDAQG